jgi:DNA-binding beta-propeller fold protein YncE
MHPRRTFPGSAAIGLAVLLPAMAFPPPRDAVVGAPASGQIDCTVNLPTPIFIPMGLVPGGLVFDDACQFLYLTNPFMNRVEVLSLSTMSFQEPVQVGAQPVGLDTAPGGALLYVANSGGNNLSVVDLARRVEARKIRMPYDASRNDRPYSVVVASNGKAFYSTAFNGSGSGSRVMELDLATEQSVQRLTISQTFTCGGATTGRRWPSPAAKASVLMSTDTFTPLRTPSCRTSVSISPARDSS